MIKGSGLQLLGIKFLSGHILVLIRLLFWEAHLTNFLWSTPPPPGFHSEIHPMFSIHTTLEKFENVTVSSNFGFAFEENLAMEITWLSWCYHFWKAFFSKCFPFTLKRTAGILKFLWFEECFWKVLFSWQSSVGMIGLTLKKYSCVFKFLCTSVDGASFKTCWNWYMLILPIIIGFWAQADFSEKLRYKIAYSRLTVYHF